MHNLSSSALCVRLRLCMCSRPHLCVCVYFQKSLCILNAIDINVPTTLHFIFHIVDLEFIIWLLFFFILFGLLMPTMYISLLVTSLVNSGNMVFPFIMVCIFVCSRFFCVSLCFSSGLLWLKPFTLAVALS